MFSVIETVSRSVGTVNRAPSSPLKPLSVDEASSTSGPSAIFRLGSGTPETLTYTNAGTFDSQVQAEPSQASADLTTSAPAPDSGGDAAAAELTAAALVAIGAAKIAEAVSAAARLENAIAPSAVAANPASAVSTEPSPAPADTATARTNTTSSTATASTTAGNAITAPTVANVTSSAASIAGATAVPKFSVDSAVQALSNVAENPAYAGMAAAFYLNVAAYRSPLALVLPLPDRADTPKAIYGVSAARPVDAERQETNPERRNGGSRARGLRA